MGRLDDKVAIISGGARGQGASEARLFAREGARVMLGDVLDDEGELVAKEIGEAAAYRHLDVTAPQSWSAFVEDAQATFGRVDVLINNAGIFRITPLVGTSVDAYLEVVRVNQLGCFLGMQAVAPVMAGAGRGSIVNISSIAGLRGSPGTLAYTATKFAVRGMTKVAALELASSGVRVNSIHPGLIDTPMLADLGIADEQAKRAIGGGVPIGAVASAEQVAKLALFLASDDSDHCTGSEFVVDGGITAGMGFTRI